MSAAVGQCVEDLRTSLAEIERLSGLDRGFAGAGLLDGMVGEGFLRLVAVGEGGRG